MAADDRLLKRSETISTSSDDMLNPYREFEYYLGMRQQGSDTYPSVWYSRQNTWTSPLNGGDLYNIPYSNSGWSRSSDGYGASDGIEVLDYELGTSSAVTPLRHKLIPSKKYLTGIWNYYIVLSTDNTMLGTARTSDGTNINYKFQLFWGWNAGYKSDGTGVWNPFIGYLSLSDMKTNLTGDIFKRPSAFAFVECTCRASRDHNISYTVPSTGNVYTTHSFTGLTRYYVKDGIKKQIKNCLGYSPLDGYGGDDPSMDPGSPDYKGFWIPGNYHDYADPNTYFIYGIAATDIKLINGAYISLCGGGVDHSTKLTLIYIGDDSDYYLSSGQSTNSVSGFLNFSSGSIDRKDKLRYIYMCISQFSRGFSHGSFATNNNLWIAGIVNPYWNS